MSDEPPIPNAHDAVAVARWFIEHDADLEHLRAHCPPYMKEWVVDEIRMAVQTQHDVRRLRRLYRKWFEIWSTRILPRSAARLHRGRRFTPLEEVGFRVEALWEAKTRILGYIIEQMTASAQDHSV
jgi:hypothetical protein